MSVIFLVIGKEKHLRISAKSSLVTYWHAHTHTENMIILTRWHMTWHPHLLLLVLRQVLSELAAQFLRLFLFGFKGALGAKKFVHRLYHVLHLPGEIWITILQLLLLLPQVGRRVHQLSGPVAALAPHLLHVRQQHLHAFHQLLQLPHCHIQTRCVPIPHLGVVWSLGLRLAVWLCLHPPAAALKCFQSVRWIPGKIWINSDGSSVRAKSKRTGKRCQRCISLSLSQLSLSFLQGVKNAPWCR